MMSIEDVISGLQFTAGMVTFNPLNGETIDPKDLNEQDKLTYDACMGAIELLKTQQPVIMSLDEVNNAGGLVYYERKGDWATPAYVYKVGVDSYDIMTMGNDGYETERSFDYGVGWRIWSVRPKHEKAVKWDEPQKEET